MKFCTSCGQQLADDAMFCSVCGTKQEAPVVEAAPAVEPAPVVEAAPAVEPVPVVKPVPAVEPAPAPQKEKNGIFSLFSFIGDLMAIVSAFFAIASLAAADLDINAYIGYSSVNAYGYLETNAGCALLGFLLSMGVIATGVLSLISSLKNHEGQKSLFKSIKKLTLGSFLFILGIVLMANA